MRALNRLAPTACHLAEVRPSRIAALGIASERAAAIQQLAGAVADERIRLSDDADPEVTADALQELPGIGPWTAGYIVMRALGWPDAWPDGDLGLLKAAGTRSPASCHGEPKLGGRGAYAAMLLWESLHLNSKGNHHG